MEQLQQVLKMHVAPRWGYNMGGGLINDISPYFFVHTLFRGFEHGGLKFTFGNPDGAHRDPIVAYGEQNSAKVTTRDIVCSNGVIQIVDAVLLPKFPTMSIMEILQTTPDL